ncbi:SAM-dependent methyltransferase [Nitrosomonadaceae bacterium]|nr:RsmB/NOP family class I SAM-dependent RNA methyltransferase [Nitrosospira sp.]MDW7664116.1 RsmB/NOP family class I SAM-dependent RNA methyltransferase [Nitrosomonadaceae bacterium]MBI0408295.1 RsmB/NOP family class I SAM-dependent RNA methyltransferase [Nitrosospira sp.]MBI0417401.1 RsmB/NOP family class I SAM-dependent RNA methyltransferase [Nitrosospira sp.]MBI0419136.1 RsmB/NOP family class I SAM-dependent RNA methyltransferase [Nitrosospira sp.]
MRLTPIYLDSSIAALRAVQSLEHPADAMLRYFFRENPELGVNDRAFIAEIIFGILRHRFFLESVTETSTPRALVLAYLVKFYGMNLRELLPLVSETEVKWLSKIKAVSLESQSSATQAEFPDWLMEKLQNFMSDKDILNLGLSLQQSASLDLRVNTLITSRDEVLAVLSKDGIEAQITPYSPIGIRLIIKSTINRHELFLSGKIEIQDEGSQLLGYLLGPKRGNLVVDFCAGSGGKTLMLGALMCSQGRIYAFDISEKRLNALKPRLKRSGLSNLSLQRINNENDLKVKRLTGKIDRVLVDAPCSGLGTLRRNPDLKWRQSPQSIEELKCKQKLILSAAAKLLKPGGRLVYATCSFLAEENQEIIEHFLVGHNQFKLLNCAELLAQHQISLDTGRFLQLLPNLHGTDGFFAAALEFVKKEI